MDESQSIAAWLCQQRWFGGKARTLCGVEVDRLLDIGNPHWIALVRALYADGPAETYVLLVRAAGGAIPTAICDGLSDPAFARRLLELITQNETVTHAGNDVVGRSYVSMPPDVQTYNVHPLFVEQSNSSLVYGERFVLKLYRKLEEGINPELEIYARLLGAGVRTPALAGAIELASPGTETRTLAILQEYVPNRGDAWTTTLGLLDQLCDEAAANDSALAMLEVSKARARRLGMRTVELHAALARPTDDPRFAPEPFSPSRRQDESRRMQQAAREALVLLASRRGSLPAECGPLAERLFSAEPHVLAALAGLACEDIQAMCVRCHGDYHLGQVLETDDDFVIVDFEGEPARSLAERRAKQPPLRDVAGMVRSFDYARHVALDGRRGAGKESPHDEAVLASWFAASVRSFLGGYRDAAGEASFLPADPTVATRLLDVYLLEKALYELVYELNNRPGWAAIPLLAILELAGG